MDTKELGDSSPTNFEGEYGKQNIVGRNTSKLVGDKGEKLACEYLVKNRYRILGRNYRINFGEIDIIARKKCGLINFLRGKTLRHGSGQDDKTIHFIEVKTLTGSGNFYPEEHVNYKKQNKYRRLAEIWLEKNKFSQNYPCQIDIIAVSMDEATGEPRVDYFENIISDKNYGF